MMSTYNPTFRGTQHSETADLPFGQVATTGYQGISYSISPDRAPYPLWQQYGQPTRRAPKFDYVLNGDSLWYGEFKDKRMTMTESLANTYRGIGYNVVKESLTPQTVTPEKDPEQTTGSSLTSTRAQILSIVRDEYGDDISLLHENSVKLGNALQSAYEHRMDIESKVGNALIEHQEFHGKLSELGLAQKLHETLGHSGGFFGLPSLPTLLMIAGVGYFALRKKR